MNYYERHIGDYLKDTAHLSLLEHGIYARLLDVYYTREAAIPEDQAARLIGARSKDEREAMQAVLSEFFERTEGGWTQHRCEREIARFQDKQSKARSSAQARWGARETHSEGNANASPDAMRTHSEGNAPRARPQSPDTNNQTPIPPPLRGSPPAAAGPRPAKKCPASFELTPELRQWAREKHPAVNADAETEKFRDHTFGTARSDWEGTWRNWIRKAAEAPPGKAQRGDRIDRQLLTAGLMTGAIRPSEPTPTTTLETFDVESRIIAP